MYKIFIDKLVVDGIHGLTEKEKHLPQRFRVDIAVETESNFKTAFQRLIFMKILMLFAPTIAWAVPAITGSNHHILLPPLFKS